MKYEYYYFINICYPKNIYTQRNLIEIKLKSDCIYHFQIDLKSIWTSVWIKTDVRLDPNQSKNMRICVYILGKSKHLICVHIFGIKNIIILSIFCMYFFFHGLPSQDHPIRGEFGETAHREIDSETCQANRNQTTNKQNLLLYCYKRNKPSLNQKFFQPKIQ